MGKLANFLPSTNGLRYINSWPDEPDLQIPTPFGNVRLGDAANGLCGGMAFAVRDLFEAGRMPPATSTNPDGNSPAFNFLVRRLFDSFNIPSGVAQYYEWMNLPAHDDSVFGVTTVTGLSHRTIEDTMPLLRHSIDSGHPCPLGLVRIHSTNPADLGHNHQVLAYGYEDQGTNTTVWVYDPNHPGEDGVTISFDHSDPTHTTTFRYSTGEPNLLGFFTVPYTAADPTPLFEDGTTPPPGWQSPAAGAVLTGKVNLVFRPFPDVDTVNFSAYYATNPSDITSVGWHQLGVGVRQADGTFALAWDSGQIPDQGNAGWGTVNLAAGSSKQGAAVNPTCYRLVSTKNNTAPPPPPKVLVCTVSPHPVPLEKPVTVDVVATDRATGAAVAGTVTIRLAGVTQYSGPTGHPFSFTFTPRVFVAGKPDIPVVHSIYPVMTVAAPGYPATPVNLGFPTGP